jgi:hypothetical protein
MPVFAVVVTDPDQYSQFPFDCDPIAPVIEPAAHSAIVAPETAVPESATRLQGKSTEDHQGIDRNDQDSPRRTSARYATTAFIITDPDPCQQ